MPTLFSGLDGVERNHDWVDLGLPSGIKWATCNVGASAPEEYGDYFAWGETTPKSDYAWETYKWATTEYNTRYEFLDLETLTKYNTKEEYGTIDNKTILDLEDDAAYANWGREWRMPTDEEWLELRTKCEWKLSTYYGRKGYRVQSKTNGHLIFLPAAGKRFYDELELTGSHGNYWSSSLGLGSSDAWYVAFCSDNVFPRFSVLQEALAELMPGRYLFPRFHGMSVRPVFAV
ncbi:MAG: hypothetical protein ACI30H_08505 [Paludibacteraceae bacterium]